MSTIRTLSYVTVSGIIALQGSHALAAGASVGVAAACVAQTAKSYPGLTPLVNAHRAEQVKMVKLWRTIKEGKGTDQTAAEYKEQQARVGKASERVSEYISLEKWSAEDRAEMQRLWAAELEKPVE